MVETHENRLLRNNLAAIDLFRLSICFPNTDHVTTPRRESSFKVGHFHARTHSF